MQVADIFQSISKTLFLAKSEGDVPALVATLFCKVDLHRLAELVAEFSGGIPRIAQLIVRGLAMNSKHIKTLDDVRSLLEPTGRVGNFIIEQRASFFPNFNSDFEKRSLTSVLLMSLFFSLFFFFFFSNFML